MARAKLYADRVNEIKMVKVNGKWPFAPVVLAILIVVTGAVAIEHLNGDGFGTGVVDRNTSQR